VRRTFGELYGSHIIQLFDEFPSTRDWYVAEHKMLRVPDGSHLFFGYAEHAAGATLSLLGGSDTATFTGNVNNSGTFQTGNDGLGNNTVTVTGTLTNNAGGTLGLYGSGDAMNVNAFSNAGAVTVGAGTTLTVTGTANGYNYSGSRVDISDVRGKG